MKTLDIGDHFIVRISNGEGLEYEVTNNIITPFRLIKTLSREEVVKYGS